MRILMNGYTPAMLLEAAVTEATEAGGGANAAGLFDMLGKIFLSFLVLVVLVFVITFIVGARQNRKARLFGKVGIWKTLTPTQHFVLAMSAFSPENRYESAVDIWGTCTTKDESAKARKGFVKKWGEPTEENVNRILDERMAKWCPRIMIEENAVPAENKIAAGDDRAAFLENNENRPEEIKEPQINTYEALRTLNMVGGAYMAAITPRDKAAEAAVAICKRMQQEFSSWNEVAVSYVESAEAVSKEAAKGGRKMYIALTGKSSWFYDIAWDTELKAEEM